MEVPLTVEHLAETLQEPKKFLLRQVLRTLGIERTAALLAEALQCEASGGMLTKDGTRRRTLGGKARHAFLYIYVCGVKPTVF